MAGTWKTQSVLLTEFASNGARAITAVQSQDHIVSSVDSPTTCSTTYAANLTTDSLILAGHATVAFAVTAFTAVGCTGKRLTVFNTNAAVVTLNTTSSQTIDSVTSVALEQNQSITIESDGANWRTVDAKIYGLDSLYNPVFSQKQGKGIKVGISAPTFGWKDLLGQIVPAGTGGVPTSMPIRGTGTHNYAYSFQTNDQLYDITFHMPHDYVPNTDIFFHVHWTHAGSAISGSLVLNWYFTYCKGYNQSGQTFYAEKNVTQTVTTTNVTNFPQYGHFINEFQISNAGGDSTHLDTSALEVDALIKVGMVASTIPTISGSPGGSSNNPFILMADIHYQSTQMATFNKNAPFYS